MRNLFIGIFVIVLNCNVFARESKANPSEKVPSPMTTASGALSSPAKIMKEMRNETAALMEESDRLRQEHSSLKAELSKLLSLTPTTKSSQRSLNTDIAVLKEKNQTLERKLSTLEKKQKLRDLQLDDLELEQRQLMLNDKVQLQEQLMNPPALPKTSSIASADAARESGDLSSRLFAIRQQKAQRDKNIKGLKKENAHLLAAIENEYAQKTQEKRVLEKEIAVLQSPRAVKSKDSGATVDNR